MSAQPIAVDKQLEAEVLEHLWREFPEHCLVLGDPQARRVVDLAAERAAARGFTAVHHVSSWASLMVYLGSYFDEDPQYPWASAVLAEAANLSRQDALERLYAKTADVLSQSVGEDGEYYRRALIWARAQPFEAMSGTSAGLQTLDQWLRKAWPRKFDSLSHESLLGMLKFAEQSVRRDGLASPAGAVVYALLMFLLGSYIGKDPVHPWAGEVIADLALVDPAAKARALHTRALAELDRYMYIDRITRGR